MKNKISIVLGLLLALGVTIIGALYISSQKEDYFLNSVYADLIIGEQIIRVYRTKEGVDSKEYVLDWWNQKATVLPLEKTQGKPPMDFLFKDEGNVDLFYYSTELSTYYLMNPGGYESIALVDDVYIEKAAVSQYSDVSEDGVSFREQCKESIPENKSDPVWREVTCTGYHKYPDIVEEFENGYMKTCFIPVSESKYYIEFDMPVTSIGSEVDNCGYLFSAGVLGASL